MPHPGHCPCADASQCAACAAVDAWYEKLLYLANRAVCSCRTWQQEEGVFGDAYDPFCDAMDNLEDFVNESLSQSE